jgi:hypothetical protein
MGQTPLLGPTLDRMFWDRLTMILDPEAVNEIAKASQRRNNLNGTADFWIPGQMAPSRGPDLGNALGR